MARPLSFRWDEGFLARLDEARGDVPRSRFVRRAVEQALSGEPSGASPSVERDPESLPRARPTVPTVPAVQPEAPVPSPDRRVTFSLSGPPGRARRSDEAKRGMQPIEKGGKS